MKYDEYLEKYQPFIYNTFINSLKFNKVSQAYLIKGSDGTPTLDIALFLAKTLICEEPSPLACSSCLNCIRFEEGNYADFMLIDGSKNTIKVGDIENLQKKLMHKLQTTLGIQCKVSILEPKTLERFIGKA